MQLSRLLHASQSGPKIVMRGYIVWLLTSNSTLNHRMSCFVGDSLLDCRLWVFGDADYAGEFDLRSTTGCVAVIVGQHVLRKRCVFKEADKCCYVVNRSRSCCCQALCDGSRFNSVYGWVPLEQYQWSHSRTIVEAVGQTHRYASTN